MREPLGVNQTFQAAAILAAISVPLLAGVSAVDAMADNLLLVRAIAIAGFLFLLAALFSFFELWEVRKFPGMVVSDALRELASSKGLLLAGLVTLLIFQVAQTRTMF